MISKEIVLNMVISAMSLAIMNVFLKHLHHIPALELVFFRSIGSLLICLTYLKLLGISILGINRRAMLMRGFLGAVSMACFFVSIKSMPLGTAVSIRYLSPIFAAGIAIFFLGEKVRILQWLFYFVAFSGVMILKQFDTQVDLVGLTFALMSALFSGMVYVSVRRIGQGDHPIVVVNYFMFCATILGGTLAIPNWVIPLPYDWIFIVLIGVFGFFGQLFMTKALQKAETSRISPLKYLEAIFVILIGYLWLGESYPLISIVGILLIIVGMTANILIRSKHQKIRVPLK